MNLFTRTFSKIFKSSNQQELDKIQNIVEAINNKENEIKSLILTVSLVPLLLLDSLMVKILDKFFASTSMLSLPCLPVNVFAFFVLTNNPFMIFL